MPRPNLNPSDEQRKKVKQLAACGFTHETIGQAIGVRSPKTLRKHFREQLDRGALEANANVALTGYQMAISGKHPLLTMFWLKCRLGWKEQQDFSVAPAPPPFIVAKEAA